MFAFTLSYSLIIWRALCFNKLEISLHKHTLCQDKVKIGPVVLEKNNFKFSQCVFAISLLPSFGKGLGDSFDQT